MSNSIQAGEVMTDSGRFDVVALKNIKTGEVELIHRDCAGADEKVVSFSPEIMMAEEKLVCTRCGEQIDPFARNRSGRPN